MKMKKKIVLILAIIILFIGLIIWGIPKYKKYLKDTAYVNIQINGQNILLDNEKTKETIDLDMLCSRMDTIIKIDIKNAKVKVNKKEIKKSEDFSLGKISINDNNNIIIEVKKFGDTEYLKYEICTVPKSFPHYEIEDATYEEKEEGDYYITTYLSGKNQEHYIYQLDNSGQLVFYKRTPHKAFNFKKTEFDGNIRYTYLETTSEIYEGVNSAVPAKLVVLDENYQEINRIGYITSNGEIPLENHDYFFISDNHYIVGGYEKRIVTNIHNYEGQEVNIWNYRLQEINDGKIIWEFQSVNNPHLIDLYNENEITIKPSEPYINYMHFNSIKIDPEDENLVCSFRNIDALIKLNRNTGEIMWILGGKGDQFGLTDEQKFSQQHSISFLKNHEILLFDNAINSRNTRILIIKIDEINKKIESYKSYPLNNYISVMGSVQVLNEEKGTFLVTYGVGESQYAFEEINLNTSEELFKFKLTLQRNILFCVNKYK